MAREDARTLHLLCCTKSPVALEAVRSLLGKGENPRKVGDEGMTPLHVACAYDNLAVCQLLLHYGANPLAVDDNARTPMDMATGTTKLFLARYLKNDQKSQRGILRRIFMCHTPSLVVPKPKRTSFLAGMRQRFRKSLGFVLRRRTKLPIENTPKKVSSMENLKTPATKTPRRRAKTPDANRTPATPATRKTTTTSTTTTRKTAVNNKTGSEQVATKTTTTTTTTTTPRRKKVEPSAPPMTPARTPARTPAKKTPSPPTELSDSQYLTAEESFQLIDLEERLRELTLESKMANVDENKMRRIKRLKDTELRAELKSVGIMAGPICAKTRKMYEKKLALAKEDVIAVQGATYSKQLEVAMNKKKYDTARGKLLDGAVRKEFEGKQVTAFVYILLDPRLAKDTEISFKRFIEAIFYIGKGTKARPLAHLIDARKLRETKSPKLNSNSKLKKIDEIWNAKHGVGLIELSHNICNEEAFVREAAFVETIRLENLTNIKSGQWHGKSRTWNALDKMEFGVFLLLQVFEMFKINGIRRVFPDSLPEAVFPFVTTRRP